MLYCYTKYHQTPSHPHSAAGDYTTANPDLHKDSLPPKLFIAIPARLQSSRLPGKPLATVHGIPMICKVVDRAMKLGKHLQARYPWLSVTVLAAIDDTKVEQTLIRHFSTELEKENSSKLSNLKFVMTKPELLSGTDRIFEALRILHNNYEGNAAGNPKDNAICLPHKGDLVLNIQGDEPFFSIDDLMSLIDEMLKQPQIPMATLAFRRADLRSFLQANFVKVTTDKNGIALYFSRAPIPWPREKLGAQGLDWLDNIAKTIDVTSFSFLHHIGVYAYRFEKLCEFATGLGQSTLESLEGLEQLRALEAGWKILVVEARHASFGIDTPEDLERAQQIAES